MEISRWRPAAPLGELLQGNHQRKRYDELTIHRYAPCNDSR
jgi:hypothetical protein